MPALPPPPPAIVQHVQQVAPGQNAAQPFARSSRGFQLNIMDGNPFGRPPKDSRGRWLHVRHWKGRRHRSLRVRSNKRKAARKANNRR